MLRTLLNASLLLLLGESDAFAAADSTPRTNCRFPHQLALNLTPAGAGPLTLAAVHCNSIPASPFTRSAAQVSPNARLISYYDHNAVLRVTRLNGGGDAWTSYNAALGVFARFGSEIRSALAFTWDSHSSFIWTATHERAHPSGFALSPMRPARTAENGTIQLFPQIEHSAGPLDALLWAGGDGLAVAQFGTKGNLYRPEHKDPRPTFAVVNVPDGRVLDTLSFETIVSLRDKLLRIPPYILVKNVAATVLPDGHVRALLSVGEWIVWTQHQAPRTLPDPYAGEAHQRMVLSPDGSSVLIGRLLRTDGGRCGRTGGCKPGRPVEGILAALHDLETGKPVWTIRATVNADYEFLAPAISDNGRFALVGLVPNDTGTLIGVVSMIDGKIVQTLPAPGGDYAMGFACGGRTVWTHANGLTALYDIQ